MSYREIHELFVVCDECHTSLSVDDATYEDADNEAVDHGWQYDELQGRHYCPLHWHVECHDCDITDSGAPDELEAAGWHIDRDYPCDSLCPNHRHLSCRECRKWDVGPLHRLEYEGWQVNSIDPSRKVRRFDTTPTSMPGTRFGRRSPMPWRSGMLGTRSSVSVMSWSRRICTRAICVAGGCPVRSGPSRWMSTVFSSSGACPNRRPVNERPDPASVPERSQHCHLRQQRHRTRALHLPSPPSAALRRLRQVVESLSRLDALDHLDRNARLGYPDALAQHLGIGRKSSHPGKRKP